jgi:hypothetical protein
MMAASITPPARVPMDLTLTETELEIYTEKNEPPLFTAVFVVYSHYYMFRPT